MSQSSGQNSGWQPEPETQEEALARQPIGELIRTLVTDGRAFASAQGERYKAQASFIAANVRDIAIFGALALFLLFGLIVALLVGLILALSPLLGAWGALGTVMAGALIAIAILGLFILSRIQRIKPKKINEAE
jgi:ABC-type multidrug transport system fused ATPase/permease subunit